MKPKSLIDSLAQFTPEDGQQWSEWEPSNPIFDKFFILGPKSFEANDKEICVLYEFPEKCASDISIQQFLFLKDEPIPDVTFGSFHKEGHFCSVNPTLNEAIFFKNETGTPIYIYCLRFIASPFTRPSELINDNVFIELEKYRNSDYLPQRVFALCIESSHPFYELYLMILNRILQFEAKSRVSAQNLYSSYDSLNNIQHDYLWPNSSFLIRESFLLQLQETFLPCYEESLVVYSNGISSFTFQMPKLENVSFSIAIWSYKPLLEWIKLEDFLKLLSILLLEQSIVILGSNPDEINKTAAFLHQLINPFGWVCPFISILPPSIIDMLSSPFPIIIGLLSEFRSQIPSYFCIIDLDKQKIFIPQEISETPKAPKIPKLPYAKDLTKELSRSSYPFKKKKDSLNENSIICLMTTVKKFIQEKIAKAVIKSIVAKLGNDGMEGSMFLSQLFFKFFEADGHPFIERFIKTQMFNAFKEQKCRNKTMLTKDTDELTYNKWYHHFFPENDDKSISIETKPC